MEIREVGAGRKAQAGCRARPIRPRPERTAMHEQHPDFARALVEDRQETIRRQFHDARDAKVARQARRRAR